MTVETNHDTKTHQWIYTWAYRLLQNHHDALDATQEVLLRSIIKSAPDVENERAWLRRVTINHCIDMVRKRKPVAPLNAALAESPSAAGLAADRETHRAVVDGLGRLSDRQRAVLVAKIFDLESFATIADAMGLSVSSVKTHYVRALHALREPLRKHLEA